ncbi:MAG: hypothetical protein JKY34_00955 [Kordiimonadaceae bacterium]|nr:hypothetical protein [Kordiimonadaceae bacterium]
MSHVATLKVLADRIRKCDELNSMDALEVESAADHIFKIEKKNAYLKAEIINANKRPVTYEVTK